MTGLFSAACNTTTAEEALLVWYRHHQRDLPWRKTRDPYRVWVSEIMLQQTQVVTVLPRYAAWLDRFPTLAAVADAGEDKVLKAWEGLGYYRRARLLYRAACLVMERHEGRFPQRFDEIVALPGIGRSTAGAIVSACFDLPYPVLDANVKRVLRRWHQLEQSGDRPLWVLAQQALERSQQPAMWNQAMMELGACCCQARQVRCNDCPLEHHCHSAHQPITVTPKSKKVKNLHWRIHIHHHPQKGLWLSQRPSTGVWGGLWTPPIETITPQPDQQPDLIHQLTHRRIHLYAHTSNGAPHGDGDWITSLESVALPTGITRLLQQLGICRSDTTTP